MRLILEARFFIGLEKYVSHQKQRRRDRSSSKPSAITFQYWSRGSFHRCLDKRRNFAIRLLGWTPRFLSTLHFHKWIGNFASESECEQFKQAGVAFFVESEISRQVLNQYSPRVQFIAFNIDNDMGLFRLQDHYPDQSNLIDISWLLECDDAFSNQLPVGSKAACCGYSAAVSEEESKKFRIKLLIIFLKCHWLLWAFCLIKITTIDAKIQQRPAINLDHITKPGLKSFAPETIDHANAEINTFRYGISASVWKGSSGGPCFLLEGPMAGAIIGIGKKISNVESGFF